MPKNSYSKQDPDFRTRFIREIETAEYPNKVLNEVRYGRMDVNTATGLTSPEFAVKCEKSHQQYLSDLKTVANLTTKYQGAKRFPKLDGYLFQITGHNRQGLNKEDYERFRYLKQAYGEMMHACFRSGILNFASVAKYSSRIMAKTFQVEWLEENAHTIPIDDYIKKMREVNSRSAESVRKEHLNFVKAARKAGITLVSAKSYLTESPTCV